MATLEDLQSPNVDKLGDNIWEDARELPRSLVGEILTQRERDELDRYLGSLSHYEENPHATKLDED